MLGNYHKNAKTEKLGVKTSLENYWLRPWVRKWFYCRHVTQGYNIKKPEVDRTRIKGS